MNYYNFLILELEADKISNFKQALEWLICATEQAHPEARRMLRRYLTFII